MIRHSFDMVVFFLTGNARGQCCPSQNNFDSVSRPITFVSFQRNT